MKYSFLLFVLMSMSLSASVNTFALDTTGVSPQASTSDIVLTENTQGVTPQETVTSSGVVLPTDPTENTGIPPNMTLQDSSITSESTPDRESSTGISDIVSSSGSEMNPTATGIQETRMVGTKPISTNTCKVNGQEVDCTQIVGAVASVATTGLWIILIVGILCLIGGIFWLVMLIHAISKPIPNKVLWILIIFFLNLLGAIIYYFVIRKNFNPAGNPSINNLINPVYMAPVAPAPVAPAPVAPAPVAPAPVAPAPVAPAPVAPAALNSMTPPPVQ